MSRKIRRAMVSSLRKECAVLAQDQESDNKVLAYWLAPSREPLVFFQGLAETFSAFSNRAGLHVTVYAGKSLSSEDPRPIIQDSIARRG